jgi:hypothetical protein
LDSAIDKFKSGKSFSKDLIENKMKYVFVVDESWEDYLYWQKMKEES